MQGEHLSTIETFGFVLPVRRPITRGLQYVRTGWELREGPRKDFECRGKVSHRTATAGLLSRTRSHLPSTNQQDHASILKLSLLHFYFEHSKQETRRNYLSLARYGQSSPRAITFRRTSQRMINDHRQKQLLTSNLMLFSSRSEMIYKRVQWLVPNGIRFDSPPGVSFLFLSVFVSALPSETVYMRSACGFLSSLQLRN